MDGFSDAAHRRWISRENDAAIFVVGAVGIGWFADVEPSCPRVVGRADDLIDVAGIEIVDGSIAT